MDYIFFFIITVAILVFVHEFGHFAAAKISKMRVDIFAIGFGKRLFGWNKLSGFSWGDLPKDWDGEGNTDYRLCLLPLGGYVKIAGMIDETIDTKFVAEEPKPYEFRAKSTIAKLFVITAGVGMNFLLTILILWGINFFQEKEIVNSTTINYIEKGGTAEKLGFKSLDKINSINGNAVNSFDEIAKAFLFDNSSSTLKVNINRNNLDTTLNISRKAIKEHLENNPQNFFIFPYPAKPIISIVVNNSPAEEAGIKDGDYIISINNQQINESQKINEIISGNKNQVVQMVLLRGKDTLNIDVKPSIEGMIGIQHGLEYQGKSTKYSMSLFESFSQAIFNIKQYTILTFSTLKSVITGKTAFDKAFGGPVKIAQFAVKSADTGIVSFLQFLAMLSLSLAIINILPFPVLDGGHFVIILIEGLIKKELPIKVKVAIQNVGFVILLLLMAFIIYSDVMSL